MYNFNGGICMSQRLKTREVLELLNIRHEKLRKLERDGILVPVEKTSRSKYFDKDDVMAYLNKSERKDKKVVVYYRVSSSSQKKELQHQLEYLENYVAARGIIVDEYIKDIGSGINYNKKGLNHLMEMIINGEVSKVIISHKDRLVRFGYELIENICKFKGVELVVINLTTTSPQEELVEDLMKIIHVFSARLYGLRSYKKPIEKTLKDEQKDE